MTPINLASTFDYNGNRTDLSANINGSATFDDTSGVFTGFSGGTNDFLNTYAYNSLGNMTGIRQASNGGNTVTGKTVGLSYNADRRLTGLDMSQDVSDVSTLVSSSARSYNGDSQLTDLMYTTATGGGGSVLAGYHWDYNGDGNVSDFYSHNDSSAGTPNTSYVSGSSNRGHAQYGYDAAQQLTGATYSDFTDPPSTGTSETYDANGNRTAGSSVSSTNRVLFDGTYYYAYDAAGNRTAKFENSVDHTLDSHATNITTYAWDNDNRLLAVKTFSTYSDIGSNDPATSVAYSYLCPGQVAGAKFLRVSSLGIHVSLAV